MDRQTVSTEDYAKLKTENEKFRQLAKELDKKLHEVDRVTSELIKLAYLSVAHKVLYAISFVYMLVDLIMQI